MKKLVLLSFLFVGAVNAQPVISVGTVIKDNQPLKVLKTSIGLVLYTFDVDVGTESKCYEDCAEKWPPLLVSDVEAREVDLPFGITVRKNGLKQVTHHGKPVYTFYLDRTAEDFKGDGLGNVWHIIQVQ